MNSVHSSGDFGDPIVIRNMEPPQKKIDGSGEAIDEEAEYALDSFIEASAGNQDSNIQGCESISSGKAKRKLFLTHKLWRHDGSRKTEDL